MNFLALIPLLSNLIDRLFPDKLKQDQAKAELLKAMSEANKAEWEAKGQVVVSEAQGESWLQRNWRPISMLVFLGVIVNNYILAPWLGALHIVIPTVPIADKMWSLLEIGIGGYIVGRSGEKIASNFNNKKFFDSLRTSFNGLTQAQVDAINKALNSAESEE